MMAVLTVGMLPMQRHQHHSHSHNQLNDLSRAAAGSMCSGLAAAQRFDNLDTPYQPLETMRPMADLHTGRPLTTAELDAKGEGSWGDRFHKLILSRLNGTNFAE